MEQLYGLPQPLTGNEIVTIQQEQNGQFAKCSMPLSEFVTFILAGLTALSTAEPSEKGVLWNNAGVVSIS
ncbi:hypothetical protein [Paraburkholderia unamae]|uniref:hypothetical protein n=1 Tax=Paraburkholderia unamae TaxID=219649 RepID=UPI0010576EEC|nr:hypothetical protein [Paraburkholderia unamae]